MMAKIGGTAVGQSHLIQNNSQQTLDRFLDAKKSPSRGHNLVEAAGIEPASACPLPTALHA